MTTADVAERRFYAWARKHPELAGNPMAIWQAAWQHGGRHALVCSSELAELVPRLEAVTAFFIAHADEVVLASDDDEQEALPF